MRLLLKPIKSPNFISLVCSDLVKPYLSRSSFFSGVRFSYNLSKTRNSMAVVTKSISEEGIANRFWLKFQKESVYAKFTPLVVCLAAGNLEIEAFRHYISQDVHFLKAFSRAYELAEECADDDDDKAAILEFRKTIIEELKNHGSYLQEWGLDPTKATNSDATTVRYTEFLLATASGKVEGEKGLGKIATPFEKTKIAAYTLGAMTPYMRLYASLGKEIRALVSPDESSHPYNKWIETYSSEAFEASTQHTEELLDKLSIPLTGEELEVVEKLYHQALIHKIDYFSAQPVLQKTLVPLSKMIDPVEKRLMLFSDFDLTCTVVDSCAILAEIAILTAPKAEKDEQGNEARILSVDLRNTWGFLSAKYTEEYEQCIENILLHGKDKKFDYEGLSKALEELSEFERRANLRVIDSGVLKGINLEDIKRAGEHMIFQDGCKDFFQKVLKNEKLNAVVHVLSYCWCADLTRSAFASGGLEDLTIHANEFVYENAISTGEIVRTVESPIDKVKALKKIVKSNEDENSKKLMTVYIGDSVGDLLCLLEADIGIVIGSSGSLRRLATQFGVSFVPLFPGLVKKQKEFVESSESAGWKGLSGTLYTVDSWAEIHALILGHHKI